jgi:hypothetical protein
VTDLKAANEALAKALAALESPEHDADVREAEAIRNRLIELDGRIGARISAKIEAHKAIALGWREELLAPGQLQGATVCVIEDATISRAGSNLLAGTLTVGFGVTPEPDAFTADAWQAHHEEHTGKYAMAGDEIPERVLTNGVAEMQHDETVTEA